MTQFVVVNCFNGKGCIDVLAVFDKLEDAIAFVNEKTSEWEDTTTGKIEEDYMCINSKVYHVCDCHGYDSCQVMFVNKLCN